MTADFKFENESFLLKERIVNLHTIHARIISRTHDFLNESVHQPSTREKTEYSGREELTENGYLLDIFPNGRTEDDKGFVSILLNDKHGNYFKGTADIFVIDASKNEKHWQSFNIFLFKNVFQVNKYVSRQWLARHEKDLLPDNTLTLKINLELRQHLLQTGMADNFAFADDNFVFEEMNENQLIIRARVTSRTHDFSEESIHRPGSRERTEYSGRDDLAEKACLVDVYPNGLEPENEGFVSMTLCNQKNHCFKGNGTISFMSDSEHENPFAFTMQFSIRKDDRFQIKIVSRKELSLLKVLLPLLPGDCLTLRIDLELRVMKNISFEDENFLLEFEDMLVGRIIRARILSRTSDFFNESICQQDTAEKTEYSGRNELAAKGFLVDVIPNGRGDEDEGSVSIMLRNIHGYRFEVVGDISVIDPSKNILSSAPVTMSVPINKHSGLKIEQCVHPELLTKDKDGQFLAGTLILMIDIEFSKYPRQPCKTTFRLD